MKDKIRSGCKRTIGIIGEAIPGIIEECVIASGHSQNWSVSKLPGAQPSSGQGRWADVLRKASNIARRFFAMRKVDVVMMVYVDRRSAFYCRMAHFLNKKVVYYWLGSDVWEQVNGSVEHARLQEPDIHLSYSLDNADELSRFGIESVCVVCPPKVEEKIATMPLRHAVLLSIPDSRREFYGYADMMRLVDKYPDIRFHVVRSERPDLYDRSNIEFEGMLSREEMESLFDKISIVIRWPEHDGTSLILSEAAMKGKNIISRNPFPCGIVTDSFQGLCDAMDSILLRPPVPRTEYHEYAMQNLTQKAGGQLLIAQLDALYQ